MKKKGRLNKRRSEFAPFDENFVFDFFLNFEEFDLQFTENVF